MELHPAGGICFLAAVLPGFSAVSDSKHSSCAAFCRPPFVCRIWIKIVFWPNVQQKSLKFLDIFNIFSNHPNFCLFFGLSLSFFSNIQRFFGNNTKFFLFVQNLRSGCAGFGVRGGCLRSLLRMRRIRCPGRMLAFSAPGAPQSMNIHPRGRSARPQAR